MGSQEEFEAAKLRAYRQARIFEPSMEGYSAAMSVYAAAFGKPDGEPIVMLPSGETKQGWELTVSHAPDPALVKLATNMQRWLVEREISPPRHVFKEWADTLARSLRPKEK